jgi:hypothetical protein
MIPSWANLDERDRLVFRAALAFLNNRLAEPSTIEWAAQLGPDRRIERIAIESLLSSQRASFAEEPWATAWHLIEESWSETPVENGPSSAIYDIQARLLAGDRSGTIISVIVDLVAPRLKVAPVSSSYRQFAKVPRRPKTFRHVLSAGLSNKRCAISKGVGERPGERGRPWARYRSSHRMGRAKPPMAAGRLEPRLLRSSWPAEARRDRGSGCVPPWHRACGKAAVCGCHTDRRTQARRGTVIRSALAANKFIDPRAAVGGSRTEFPTGVDCGTDPILS